MIQYDATMQSLLIKRNLSVTLKIKLEGLRHNNAESFSKSIIEKSYLHKNTALGHLIHILSMSDVKIEHPLDLVHEAVIKCVIHGIFLRTDVANEIIYWDKEQEKQVCGCVVLEGIKNGYM